MINTVRPARVGMSAERLERIGGWMDSYVDSGKLPGCMTLVARHGQVAYLDSRGMADEEAGRPIAPDDIFRIYSMSKPIVSAAAMALYEEGLFQLDDPVARYLPEFGDGQLWLDGEGADMKTEPVGDAMQVWHLMTHTSGLVYGNREDGAVGAAYRAAGVDFSGSRNVGTLEEMTKRLAAMPLRWRPGTRWEYSVSTDALGRFIEAVAGAPLDEVLRTRIFEPLGMNDTYFQLPAEKADRLTSLFTKQADGSRTETDPASAESSWVKPVTLFSGGGGLVSTASDYLKFCEMLRGLGAYEGTRVLGRKTAEYMMRNHLPGNADLTSMGQPVFSETAYDGIGFSLAGSVVIDAAKAKALCSEGEFAWGGVASTGFWVDRAEGIVAIFMTQLMPSSSYPIRRELRSLVYQAITE
ncbi:MAG: beta-lactamase family protein [Alphaproteobacteria bacterium]|nr:beta-lactamase family protein [Alphaproteobacteria bacterium]